MSTFMRCLLPIQKIRIFLIIEVKELFIYFIFHLNILSFFWKHTCQHLMNLPLDGFSIPGHSAPAPVVFSSALLLKDLVFTVTDCLGNLPSPKTLQQPDHSMSVKRQLQSWFFFFFFAAFTSVCSLTKVHSLLRLTVGQSSTSPLMRNTNFSKVTCTIFVEIDPVVICATRIAPASWALLGLDGNYSSPHSSQSHRGTLFRILVGFTISGLWSPLMLVCFWPPSIHRIVIQYSSSVWLRQLLLLVGCDSPDLLVSSDFRVAVGPANSFF